MSPLIYLQKKVKVDSDRDIVEAYGDVCLISSHYEIRADYAKYEKKR